MSKQEMVEAIHALGWIVEHLKHRPSLKDRVDLLTRDERRYLEEAYSKAKDLLTPKIRFRCQKCNAFTDEPSWDESEAACKHCGAKHRRKPAMFAYDYWDLADGLDSAVREVVNGNGGKHADP